MQFDEARTGVPLVNHARDARVTSLLAAAQFCLFGFSFVMLRFCSEITARMTSDTKSTALYQNLDTSFINLWGLLRKLSQDGFVGRVHVELKDYTADVFMNGSGSPLVHETDHAAGTDTLEEAALHRLVLRARASTGVISVFAGIDESVPKTSDQAGRDARPEKEPAVAEMPSLQIPPPLMNEPLIAESELAPRANADSQIETPPQILRDVSDGSGDIEQTELINASGKLIGAVERAVTSAGVDFNQLFRSARIAMADDFPFLEPSTDSFQYFDSKVTMRNDLPAGSFVAGLSELLRWTVNRVATGDRERRVRERVALELALLARRDNDVMRRTGFQDHFDRIAGTKVISGA